MSETASSRKSSLTPENESISMKLKSMHSMKLNVQVGIQGIIFILAKDTQSDSYKTADIAAIYIDQINLDIQETETEKKINLTISDLQFDNQLFNQGTYDFPVVFRFDETIDIDQPKSSEDIIKLEMILKKWSNMNHMHINESFSGISNIYLQLKPFKAFIEGEYINELSEYIKSMMPVNLVILPQTLKEQRILIQENYIFVTKNVLIEAEVLAKPIKINSLVIKPVYGTLSLRSNLKIYIALDDSPISFPLFERKNIITTPYRLGHALTVHFLSGAIVGAGK